VDVGQPPPDLERLLLLQQHAVAFVHTSAGADLAGRIVIVEHLAEPDPLLDR